MSDTLTPQAKMVLDYLKTGRTLTNIIAMTTLKVYALPRRIADLIEAGHKIVKERKRDFQDTAYVAYSLPPPEPDEANSGV